ncbi:MAG TPA: anti-sigma factor [Edaphobacter sp.]|nr:anti-sigma factor [Edaphobacter sp.]
MNGGFHIAQEDLALYAMNTLEGAELAEVRAHLQSCAECRSELNDVADTLVALSATVEQHPVPPGARQRFVESISGKTSVPEPVRAAAVVSPIDRGRGGARWLPWTIAAALALVAAGLGTRVNTLQQQLRGQSRMLAQEQEAGVRSQRVLALLKEPHAQRVTLTAAKVQAEPTGHAIYLADRGELIFQGSNLKSLPENKAYELWVIPANGSAAIPAGVFRPDKSGDASIVMPPLPSGVPAKAFAVSVERAEGVPKAEGPIVLSGATDAGE